MENINTNINLRERLFINDSNRNMIKYNKANNDLLMISFFSSLFFIVGLLSLFSFVSLGLIFIFISFIGFGFAYLIFKLNKKNKQRALNSQRKILSEEDFNYLYKG